MIDILLKGQPVEILYKNYKGEIAWRSISDAIIKWKISEFHSPDLAIYINAWSHDKKARRDFKPSDVLDVRVIK